MNEAGVGSFLQGLMNGYKTAKEMSMQQEQLDLKKQEIEASKKIADAKLQEEKNKLEMQAQEKQNKVMSDATKQLEEDSIKDVNYAVGKYNKTMVDNKLPSRKAILTGQDNKQYVSDFTSDTIDGYYKIQASLANNDGMYIMKNGYLHSRNPDTGDYTRTNTFGESVDSLREAYRIKQAGTGTETLADGTIVTKAEALGQKAQDKTPKISVETKVFNEREAGKQYSQIAFENKKLLKDFKDGKKLTQDQEIQMQGDEFALNEKANTKEQNQKQEVLDTLDTVENLERIKNTYSAMMKSGVKGGIAQDATVGLMKYVGTGGKFSDIANMDEKKFAKITGLESASTAQRMEIIKNLSGLSYTDKQAEQMALITGDKWGATNEAKFNAIEGYLADRKKALLNYSDPNNNFSTKNPYTSYQIQQKFGSSNTANNIDSEVKQDNTNISLATKDEVIKQGVAYEPDKYEYAIIDGKLKKRLKGN